MEQENEQIVETEENESWEERSRSGSYATGSLCTHSILLVALGRDRHQKTSVAEVKAQIWAATKENTQFQPLQIPLHSDSSITSRLFQR